MNESTTSAPTAERLHPRGHRRRFAWIYCLTLLSAISPLACDMYLPAFPAMAESYGTTPIGLQLSMTTFLLGMAVGQLVLGPFSDRFGRRGPLLASLLVCVAAGVACALAPSIELLILFRLVQGLAGSGCIVLTRAIVADTTKGIEAQKLFSVMAAVGGLAPVIAPLLGSMVLQFSGWRMVFWILVLLTLLMFFGALLAVPESLSPAQRHGGGIGDLAQNIRKMLRDRTFLGLTAAFSLSFAVMFAYIPASPFVLQEIHGLSPLMFSITFAVNALGLAAASIMAGRLVERFEPLSVAKVGIGAQLATTLALLVLGITGTLSIWMLLIGFFLAVSSLGLLAGPLTGLSLDRVPNSVGTGAAVLGAFQFGLGALVAPLVGLGGEGTQIPLLWVMASAAVLATLAIFAAGKKTKA